MQARTIVETQTLNPAFDMKAKRQAKADGKPYDVPAVIDIPVGTVIDHPQVWVHCCTATPRMTPVDAECIAKVDAFVNHPRRKALLAKIKHMATPAVFEKLPAGLKTFVKTLADKWASQIANVDADTTATTDEIAAVAAESSGGSSDAEVDDSDEGDDDEVLSDGTFGSL